MYANNVADPTTHSHSSIDIDSYVPILDSMLDMTQKLIDKTLAEDGRLTDQLKQELKSFHEKI